MVALTELEARLEALRATRAKGIRTIHSDGEQVEYRSDAELAAAIADLERQIAATSTTRPIIRTMVVNSKGYL